MTDTTQPPAETLADVRAAADFMTDCAAYLGDCGMKAAIETALREAFARHRVAALTRRAGGDAIPAGWGEMLRESAAKHAVVCAKLANETPIAGEPDPLWWERQSAIREAAVILAHVGALTTPKPLAGGDAGAAEERDALLTALGWKTGPFGDALSRKVILDDCAALRPEMVKARRAAQEAQGRAEDYRYMLGEYVHGSRSGVLGRLWEEVKRLRAASPKPPAGGDAGAVERAYRQGQIDMRDRAAAVCNERGAEEQESYGLNRAAQNYFRARNAVRALEPAAVALPAPAGGDAPDELRDFASLMVDEVIAKTRIALDAGESLSVEDQRHMLEQLIVERKRLAALALPAPVVEGAHLAAFHALHGAEADPFENPEAFEFCGKIADAVLAALSEGRSHG